MPDLCTETAPNRPCQLLSVLLLVFRRSAATARRPVEAVGGAHRAIMARAATLAGWVPDPAAPTCSVAAPGRAAHCAADCAEAGRADFLLHRNPIVWDA